MTTARRRFLAACVLTGLALAERASSLQGDLPLANAREADSAIEKSIAESHIPGAVLLVGHDSRVIYRKAYGNRALVPSREPMTADTIFDCASLTKVVATTPAIMKLYEAGKLKVDAPVTDYLPEFQNGKSDITIRDLMTHYSGLRPDLDLDPSWTGYERGVSKALSDPPAGPREEKFVYSDINFILLGEIVRRLSGKPLDEYARQEIFQPLGMNDTMFRPTKELLPRIAPTERQSNGDVLRGVVHDPTSRFMGGVAGHAGLFSTADDLGRYCRMLLEKGANPFADASHPARIFRAETVDLFTSPQNPAGTLALRGLGWDVNSPYSANRGDLFPVGKSFGHTGFTGTSIWIDPASNTYVILLTNAVHPTVKKAISSLRRSVATAVAEGVGYKKVTKTGLDVLIEESCLPLKGRRIGLITNQTGIDRQGRRNVDLMLQVGIHVTALFSPEHGISGVEDRSDIGNTVDPKTGIRVFSLFGERNRRPTPDMLRQVDEVVFDIADVGARFYTYETTMAYAMEACALEKKPFIVLDRPNPVTGEHVEGPGLDLRNRSFIGYFSLPVRHGMTIGELARLFNGENKIGADLTVIPVAGWKREDWFDATELPWVNPSPNIRDLEAAILYPALALLEASENYSVGRGTPDPFHMIGAPFVRGSRFCGYLTDRNIPGISIESSRFAPTASHLAGTEVEGCRFAVNARNQLDTGLLGLEVASALQSVYPGQISFDINRKLIGSDETIRRLAKGDDPRNIRRDEEPNIAAFRAARARYLLYQ